MKTWIHLCLGLACAIPGLAAEGDTLTLAAARDRAVKSHPRLTVAQLRALVAGEAAVEARAGFFPTITLNATTVATGEQITRISSGNLSNSQIYDHTGIGATLSLTVFDFGRTSNLADAAKKRAQAAEADRDVTRAQLLLEVDVAYFGALRARAVKSVAEKTLGSRQNLLDRTSAFAQNQLKSELDVRFARVSVDEARLLVDEAEKDWRAYLVILGNLTGQVEWPAQLTLDETATPGDLPPEAGPLIDLALAQRPELRRQRLESEASRNQARAAKDARLPSVAVLAAAGVVPTNDPHFDHTYAAGGINVSVPLFAGGLYRSRQRQAELQATASETMLKEQQDNAARDVRLAWLEANHARQRIALTSSLRDNTAAALSLARSRFDQGLSSIVELNQAELAQISADIAHATAQYTYRLRRDQLDLATGSLR